VFAPTGAFGGSGQNGNTIATTDFINFLDADVTNNTELGGPPPTYTGANSSPFGTFTVTVQAVVAVPEPSSLVLCALGGVGLAGYYGRRRRQSTSR